jgi:hypothetical protein
LVLQQQKPDKGGFLEYAQDPVQVPVVAPIRIHQSVFGIPPHPVYQLSLRLKRISFALDIDAMSVGDKLADIIQEGGSTSGLGGIAGP